ncbi:MAG: FHA domain-containing protein [Syntrophomonadaceae bacterium]
MDSLKKYLSPSLFGIILLCFFLPFVTVSCGNSKEMAISLTGMQLATGWAADEKHKEGPNPLAVGGVVLAVSGVGLGFWQNRSRFMASSIVGGLGVATLFALKTLFDNGVAKEGEGVLTTSWESGFIVAFLLFAGACVFNVIEMQKNKGSTPAAQPIHPPAREGPAKFCTKCGTKNPIGNEYCNKCGNQLKSFDVPAAVPLNVNVAPPTPAAGPLNISVAPPATAAAQQHMAVNQGKNTGIPSYDPWISGNPIGFLVVQRPGRDELIPLNKAEFSIGSHQVRADYYESRPGIDAVHASIISQNNSYFLIDHGSQAGTCLNGRRLNPGEQRPLAPGDAIMLSDIEFTFDIA